MRNCAIDGIAPQASVIREKMEKLLRPSLTTDDQKVLNLVEFIDRFIQDNKGLKSPNTIKSYVSIYNRFKQHSSLCNKQFNFEDINLSWRSSFLQFLQKRGVNRNTEGKHIKNIKVFMNKAIERKTYSECRIAGARAFQSRMKRLIRYFCPWKRLLKSPCSIYLEIL